MKMKISVHLCLAAALCAVTGFAQTEPEAGSKAIPLSKIDQ
jgi:hypothetical protein